MEKSSTQPNTPVKNRFLNNSKKRVAFLVFVITIALVGLGLVFAFGYFTSRNFAPENQLPNDFINPTTVNQTAVIPSPVVKNQKKVELYINVEDKSWTKVVETLVRNEQKSDSYLRDEVSTEFSDYLFFKTNSILYRYQKSTKKLNTFDLSSIKFDIIKRSLSGSANSTSELTYEKLEELFSKSKEERPISEIVDSKLGYSADGDHYWLNQYVLNESQVLLDFGSVVLSSQGFVIYDFSENKFYYTQLSQDIQDVLNKVQSYGITYFEHLKTLPDKTSIISISSGNESDFPTVIAKYDPKTHQFTKLYAYLHTYFDTHVEGLETYIRRGKIDNLLILTQGIGENSSGYDPNSHYTKLIAYDLEKMQIVTLIDSPTMNEMDVNMVVVDTANKILKFYHGEDDESQTKLNTYNFDVSTMKLTINPNPSKYVYIPEDDSQAEADFQEQVKKYFTVEIH